MNHPLTLLDWTSLHARDLELMRANTARWTRQGLLKTPEQVLIHPNKVMVDPAKRKNSTGRRVRPMRSKYAG